MRPTVLQISGRIFHEIIIYIFCGNSLGSSQFFILSIAVRSICSKRTNIYSHVWEGTGPLAVLRVPNTGDQASTYMVEYQAYKCFIFTFCRPPSDGSASVLICRKSMYAVQYYTNTAVHGYAIQVFYLYAYCLCYLKSRRVCRVENCIVYNVYSK